MTIDQVSAEIVTTTTAGSVRGQQVDGAVRFLGIPFAGAPVGELRFAAPVPPSPWEGVRPCIEHGPICPQVVLPEGLSPFPDMIGRGLPMSEDCLNLNVYTPAVDGRRRPTVVWIHGGAFVSGSAGCPIYDGTSFARDGVVFVSINYRLHALGFLYLDELFGLHGSGNAGVLDQVAALEWVRDNIANFGGDPDQVTLIGESAGAMSIGALLAVDSARGLFRRAILLSGAAHHTLKPESADRVARRVVEGVGAKDLAMLRSVPTDRLMMLAQQIAFMEAEQLLGAEHPGVRTVFAPVIDHDVLRGRAIDGVAGGSSDGVSVMIGSCADEYRVFIWGMPEFLRSIIPKPDAAVYFAGSGRDVDDVVRTYAADRSGADSVDIAAAVAGDAVFGIPAIRLAEAKCARGDRVWMHELMWKTPVFDGSLGACHALDVPFVFDSLDHPDFLGSNPPAALAGDLHGACVRFISTGDPNGGRLPAWAPYDTTVRAVMQFDDDPALVEDPRAHERAMWEGVW